jgi:hypothetical protein
MENTLPLQGYCVFVLFQEAWGGIFVGAPRLPLDLTELDPLRCCFAFTISSAAWKPALHREKVILFSGAM